jgi:DNA polymerase-1
MKHFTLRKEVTGEPFPVCILIPRIQGDEIRRYYLDAFELDHDSVMVLDLHQKPGTKKTPVAEIKAYIEDMLVPTLTATGVSYILCADADYFKVLAGTQKADANLGYVMDCLYGPWKVIYLPNHRTVFYDPPKVLAKIEQAMLALKAHVEGGYEDPGHRILKTEVYPQTYEDILRCLDALLALDCDLTCDIEGFGLKHYNAGIATISFAWNQHEGVAFPVDYREGEEIYNEPVRELLRGFFFRFKHKLIFHNIAYDAYVLIYQLFMRSLTDTEGLLEGLEIMCRKWDCTKLISYLATNSCAGNNLSLKDQAQEYAGNYAMGEDIKDVRKIPLEKLLRYNLVDAVSTWYVHQKHWATVVADQQIEIYETIFKPATLDIIQMQLTGLPVDMKRVGEVKIILQNECDRAEAAMQASPLVQAFTYTLNERWVKEKNETLKKKRVTLADAKEVFNPGSSLQLQELLYEVLGLPVLGWTDTKLPSTEGKFIKALVNHTNDPDVLAFLAALIDYKAVAIILSTFIPALENAQLADDGCYYIYGNFNLGGTVSGRLSSSDPNLQNLPASSKWAKLIKECIVAFLGWILVGIDFMSLEDRISALTTKDPAKLKVYTDGYDGHSLRAFAYFGDQMPDIVDTVESINSIQTKYKALRQVSKDPTFALTYQGTYHTLMTNCGFPEAKARSIEERYHALYAVSDAWVEDKLERASQDGYITAAFGLRVRTPLLFQVIRGNSKTPYEAKAEGRTAGNALGQSWCLLNSRAASEFMGKVRSSQWRLDIRPCAQIHDAQYYLVREDPEALAFVNEHLVKAVQWQDHPEIAHDEVKMGGEVGIFHPSWAHEITIPNGAGAEDILRIVDEHMNQGKKS